MYPFGVLFVIGRAEIVGMGTEALHIFPEFVRFREGAKGAFKFHLFQRIGGGEPVKERTLNSQGVQVKAKSDGQGKNGDNKILTVFQ